MVSILLVISVLISCSTHKKERISKLIYFSGRGISYDSLKHPQLSLLNYFEYSNNNVVKLAKGKDYNSYKDGHLQFGKAFPFSLNEFFTLVIPKELIENINDVLIDNSFDSVYDSKSEGWHYEYLIFETKVCPIT
jgi:hypothetical protein